MWKKIKAENDSESNLSITPPWPGIELPISLTPISLLIAEILRSPKKPKKAIRNPAVNAWDVVNGVKNLKT